MRPWAPIVLAFAAFAAAQGSNVIDNGSNGIQAKAGEPLTLTWTNPSSGTITIKIQTSGEVTPNEGIVVAENVPNTGSATFTVPADAPSGQVYIQIVDDANPKDSNFSGGFQVQGATNTAKVAASTSAAASSASESSASESSASESSASAAASSSEASASASESSTSESSASATSSRTRSAASATAESTTAPTSGAAALPVVHGGLVAAMFGAVVLL